MKLCLILALVGCAYSQTVPCGRPVVQPSTQRIVGGKVATPGSWPWTVMLVEAQRYIVGTGAIIHPNVILTSAQHFYGGLFDISGPSLSDWKVMAGQHHIKLVDPHETSYGIQNVIIHERFSTTNLLNDIALIILSSPIKYNDHTSPACLPDNGHMYTVGQTCYLPGWGGTSSTGNEETLNQVDLPILDDAICQSHWQNFLPGTEICAGYEHGGKVFCGDDTGSPLMCQDSHDSVWYIQGIASEGGNCRTANKPGIFEDVSEYRDWIMHNMQRAGFPYQY